MSARSASSNEVFESLIEKYTDTSPPEHSGLLGNPYYTGIRSRTANCYAYGLNLRVGACTFYLAVSRSSESSGASFSPCSNTSFLSARDSKAPMDSMSQRQAQERGIVFPQAKWDSFRGVHRLRKWIHCRPLERTNLVTRCHSPSVDPVSLNPSPESLYCFSTLNPIDSS